jgi:hypothetical protein
VAFQVAVQRAPAGVGSAGGVFSSEDSVEAKAVVASNERTVVSFILVVVVYVHVTECCEKKFTRREAAATVEFSLV